MSKHYRVDIVGENIATGEMRRFPMAIEDLHERGIEFVLAWAKDITVQGGHFVSSAHIREVEEGEA